MVGEPKRGSLSRAGAINVGISIGVALATYLSLALIANRFGGSVGSDAYFYLLSLTTVSTALIGGVLSAVFLPVLIELRVRDGLDEASRFVSSILTWSLILCLAISLGSYIFNDEFFSFASKFGVDVLQSQRDIFLCFGPVFFFATLCELFRLVLIAFGRYAVAAFSALFQPAFLVAMLLVSNDELRESSMALLLWLSRAGVLLFMLLFVKSFEIKFRFTLSRHASLSKFIKVSTPYAFAGLVTHFAVFFFDFMATGLGAGVLTSVTYAQRIYALPLALVITPLLEIARAKFAEFRARDDMISFQSQYNNLVKIVIYYSIPVAVVFFIYADQIVSMLFHRGAFSADKVAVSASCLQVLAFSIPLSCLFTLNGRSVESFQRLLWPSFFGSLGNVMLIFTTFFMVDSFGYMGIPMARLGVDIFYFLPMGIIAIMMFKVRFDFLYVFKILAIALLSCVIPALLYCYGEFEFIQRIGFTKTWTDLIAMVIFISLSSMFILATDVNLRRSLLASIKS